MGQIKTQKPTLNYLLARIKQTNPDITEVLSKLVDAVDDVENRFDPTKSSYEQTGKFERVPFSATDFQGNNAMTWTIAGADVLYFDRARIGNTIRINFSVELTTVAGTPDTELRIVIPDELIPKHAVHEVGWCSDNGTEGICYVYTTPGDKFIRIVKDYSGATAWAAATNATGVKFAIQFEAEL